MNNYFLKFIGEREKLPPKANLREIIFAWFGGVIAVGILGFLTKEYNNLLVMGSFGASCVLLFGFPKSPFSQPRNVILGHFISTLIGLFFLYFVGNEWWSMALALASAIAIMIAFRIVHPPAGSNPLIVFLLNPHWDYLFLPTLSGSIILVVVALFYNNISTKRVYPSYWI